MKTKQFEIGAIVKCYRVGDRNGQPQLGIVVDNSGYWLDVKNLQANGMFEVGYVNGWNRDFVDLATKLEQALL